MGISGVALQSMPTVSPSQKNDSSAEIQKLEQLKLNIKQQLRQLEQSKQGGDAIKRAKDKLQKQMKEIEQQIQVLKQQSTAEVQPTEDEAKGDPPRFDGYIKNAKEASDTGIYNLKKDEKGNSSIVFDRQKKPLQETPAPIKSSSKEDKPEIMKSAVNTDKVDAEIKKLKEQRQSIQQQVNRAENADENAALQKQLANIVTELRAKDNDAYR